MVLRAMIPPIGKFIVSRLIDLAGERFGRLIAIKRVPWHARSARWLCKCDCGQETEAMSQALRLGKVKSCGCYRRDWARKHGGWGTLEHSSWRHMRARCLNPKHKNFRHYGGRGITICDRWNDFSMFLQDMGPTPREAWKGSSPLVSTCRLL